jgi:hypothetical protein
MQIISASYRTDIPAFYGDWFMQRIREGYVRYKNPYGPQIVTVSLQPEDVHAIVFWSKNYGPFMKHLKELEGSGHDFYFHYTITAQPRLFEDRVPGSKITIESFRELSRRFGPTYVQWRYDPIIFSPLTPPQFHRDTFTELVQDLAGYTHRCYFSFVDLYAKVRRNTRQLPEDTQLYDPTDEEKLSLALELADIATKFNIALYTCSEDFAAVGPIRRGSCVDVDILDDLFPEKKRKVKLSENRGQCGCYDNRDIGAYDTCPHGCIYCYAVLNRPVALKRYKQHKVVADSILPTEPNQPPEEDAQLSLL